METENLLQPRGFGERGGPNQLLSTQALVKRDLDPFQKGKIVEEEGLKGDEKFAGHGVPIKALCEKWPQYCRT